MKKMKNENNQFIVIIVAVVVILLFGGFGMGGYGWAGGMMGTSNYGFGGMWMFGWLFMILITIALVLFIIWITKQLQNNSHKRK